MQPKFRTQFFDHEHAGGMKIAVVSFEASACSTRALKKARTYCQGPGRAGVLERNGWHQENDGEQSHGVTRKGWRARKGSGGNPGNGRAAFPAAKKGAAELGWGPSPSSAVDNGAIRWCLLLGSERVLRMESCLFGGGSKPPRLRAIGQRDWNVASAVGQ